MEITDVKIRKTFEEGSLKAIVSVTFDNELAVHDVKIIYAKEKLFLIMPSRKNSDETYKDIVHPINSEFRYKLEKNILAYYEESAAQKAAAKEPETEDSEPEGEQLLGAD